MIFFLINTLDFTLQTVETGFPNKSFLQVKFFKDLIAKRMWILQCVSQLFKLKIQKLRLEFWPSCQMADMHIKRN